MMSENSMILRKTYPSTWSNSLGSVLFSIVKPTGCSRQSLNKVCLSASLRIIMSQNWVHRLVGAVLGVSGFIELSSHHREDRSTDRPHTYNPTLQSLSRLKMIWTDVRFKTSQFDDVRVTAKTTQKLETPGRVSSLPPRATPTANCTNSSESRAVTAS